MVVQWLRICLPMQGMWVPSLVGELTACAPQQQKPACLSEDPAQAINKKKFKKLQTRILLITKLSKWYDAGIKTDTQINGTGYRTQK